MRDILNIPFNERESIVLASDNSGAIGLKDSDAVKVPYETVAYYSFRVAVMECMAAGADPFAVTLNNLCGDNAWDALLAGIKRGLTELKMEQINITGSTESNFNLTQSAVGITVLGKLDSKVAALNKPIYTPETNIAVIGRPLVGNEVVDQEIDIASLSMFKQICSLDQVVTLPVGSKGILQELNRLFFNRTFEITQLETSLNLEKSAGPSTCFIVIYPPEHAKELKYISGRHLHEVKERLD